MSGVDLESLSPAARANLIYAQAKADVNDKLWEAAIGGAKSDDKDTGGFHSLDKSSSFEALLSSMKRPGLNANPLHGPHMPIPGKCEQPTPAASRLPDPSPVIPTEPKADAVVGLGPNSVFSSALDKAAQRSGIPSPALAAIVDAEAAKRPDGTWNLHSRNPRSSAAGLGQFLSGTWIEMAERPGTWLNERAQENGWLNSAGRVEQNSRGSLLSLRYDADAAINTTADYARGNIDHLKRKGIRIGDTPSEFARAAYLGHHLGPGDAVRFLSGGLSQSRAKVLLKAQIGSSNAINRIQSEGCAATAHRKWLNAYVASHVQPERFSESSRSA